MFGVEDSDSSQGLKSGHEAEVSLDAPRRRKSRVSFASMPEDNLSSPEKGAESADQDLPPSPCRGQRSNRSSTYSFGLRMSLGREDDADADEASITLPNSPPESPGQLREAWACLKQREEELEDKQRHLEEWDFELKEEKRQHRESRLFLARKMSELEARELRAAKDEERRISGISGTPASSDGVRTPPSSSKNLRDPLRGTPPRGLQAFPELAHNTTQTEEDMAALPERNRRGSCRRLCRVGIALQVALKVCVLIGVVVVPELSSETVESMSGWLPVPIETFVSLETVTGEASVSSSDGMVTSRMQSPPAVAQCQPSPSRWGWRVFSGLVVAALAILQSRA